MFNMAQPHVNVINFCKDPCMQAHTKCLIVRVSTPFARVCAQIVTKINYLMSLHSKFHEDPRFAIFGTPSLQFYLIQFLTTYKNPLQF